MKMTQKVLVFARQTVNFLQRDRIIGCKFCRELCETLKSARNGFAVPGALVMYAYFFCRYSSMDFAPSLPAPMARMTVAAPVTASPPA